MTIFAFTGRLVAAFLLASPVMAQHEDMSPPARPAEVAFLRVVMPVSETARIDGHTFVPAPDSPASRYAVVGPDPEIIVSDVVARLQTPVGRHYSYLWGLEGTGTLVEDMMPADGKEAVLRIYNLSSVDGIELWIVGQEGAALAGLGPITAEAIVVPPGIVQAELRAQGQSLGEMPGIEALPGRGVSVVVWGDRGDLGLSVFADVHE
jgi:hypothetical protein